MTDTHDNPQNADKALPIQGASETSNFRGFLPNALAKEERMVRLKEARLRRRNGKKLTAEEIRNDLRTLLSHLMTQLSMHIAGSSVTLKLPVQALLYAERTASYAIQDYPKSFDNDSAVTGLWDALEHIYMAAVQWRKDETKDDGYTVIVSLESIAKTAVRFASGRG